MMLTSSINAQDFSFWRSISDSTTNSEFKITCDSVDDILLTHYYDSTNIKIKEYLRFKSFWGNRLSDDSTNIYKNYAQALFNYSVNPICDQPDNAQWELLGPTKNTVPWLGLISEVLGTDYTDQDNILIAPEGSGIWKYQPNGQIWENKTDPLRFAGLSITSLVRSPFNSQHIIASTGIDTPKYGIGIIESFDNGNTWQRVGPYLDQSLWPIVRLIIDPWDTDNTDGLSLHAVVGHRWGEIHMITLMNGALNQPSTILVTKDPYFTEDMSARQLNDIEISPLGGPYYKYVTSMGLWGNTEAFILRRELGNPNWQNITPGNGNYKRARITTPDANGTIYALCDYAHPPPSQTLTRYIYKSTDYGNNWNQLYSTNYGGDCKDEIEISPYTGRVYIGGIIFRILDESTTPAQLRTIAQGHVDIRDIYFLGGDNIANYEKILSANDGNLSLVNVDLANPSSGSTWTNLNRNYLPITQFMGLAVSQSSPEFVLAGATHNSTYKFDNDYWGIIHWGFDGADCAINPLDPDIYYTQGNYTVKRGNSYLPTPPGQWYIGMSIELNPNDPYIMYIGRGRLGENQPAVLNVYYDNPQNTGYWEYHNVPISMNKVGAIAINNNTNDIYIADYDYNAPDKPHRFLKYRNSDQTWHDLSSNSVDGTSTNIGEAIAWCTISDIEINPDNPNEMWLACTGLKDNSSSGGGKWRVLHSENAGDDWEDYSDGLPLFPCNSIKYLPNSNGMLFVATDVGVFYTDNLEYNSNGGWQCFSEDLPICRITGLEIQQYCNKLYASTWGYGTWKTDIPSMGDNLTIAATTDWTVDMNVNGDIVINQGCTLTVKNNAIIYMGPDHTITIKSGGKLVVEGEAEITSGGGCLWEGIIVEGDDYLSQFPETNQGVIEVFDGTISNARTAISTLGCWIAKSNCKGGGIVRLDDATLKNNITGVKINPYSNFVPSSNVTIPNVSYINNSHFITNDDFAYYETPKTFIQLINVDGIGILANEFINNSTISNPSKKGNGIISGNASFYVESICLDTYTPCDNWKKNHFEGLNYGIRAQNISPDITLTVDEAEFDNVYRSIYLDGVTNATVTSNTYAVPDISGLYTEEYNDPYVDREPYGIYLNMCNAYTVEENTISSATATYDQYTYGAIINNSFNDPNEIYKNDFSTLTCGILALNDNRSNGTNPEASGLVIKCNNNSTNAQDFEIRDSEDIDAAGIGKFQGNYDPFNVDVNSPAGNTFSHNCSVPTTDNDYDNNDGTNFWYYHHQGTSNDTWVPECYTNSSIGLKPTPFDFYATGVCESKLDGASSPGTPLSQVYSDLTTAKQNKNSSYLIYNIWKDGGNTEELETDVELAMPPQSYQLYNDLIAESPYLSEDVLIAAIQNEAVLTSLMIKLIMIANPHASRSDEVMDALISRVNPLPESWIDEIIAGSNYMSQLEVLQSDVAYDYHNYKMIIDDLKTRFINDTVNLWAKDSLVNLLTQEDNLNLRYELAFLHLDECNYTQMESVLNNIPYEFELQEEEQAIHQYYVNYFNILKDMKVDTLAIEDLDSIQLDTLQNVANYCHHYAAAWARNLLGYPNDDPETWYREPIPDFDPPARMARPVIKPVLEEKESLLKVYPNPAQEYFVLDYEVQERYNELRIDIVDAIGKLVFAKKLIKQKNQELIDLRSYKPGYYIVSLVGNGKVVESQKLSITK